MYQLVDAITCEIADTALPVSVFRFFMDFYKTLYIDSLRGSNMWPTNLNERIMHRMQSVFHTVGAAYVNAQFPITTIFILETVSRSLSLDYNSSPVSR